MKFDLSDITVVILNWMQSRLTLGAIRNLKKYYPSLPIIVVDNGTKDKDEELFGRVYSRNDKERLFDDDVEKLRLATKEYNFTLIELDENLGQGIAVDVGVSNVKTKLVLLMDNDARLLRGDLVEEYLEKMDENTFSVGIRYPYNSLHKLYVGLQFGLFLVAPIIKYHLSFSGFKFEYDGKTLELEPGYPLHESMCGEFYTDRTRKTKWKTIIYPRIEEMPDRIIHLKIYEDQEDVQNQIERWNKWVDG